MVYTIIIISLFLSGCSGFNNLGHRAGGDFIKAPENSVSCARKAIEYQHHTHFVYLECDVRETKDHELVVFHDGTLRRMMKKAKHTHSIRQMTLDQVRLFGFKENHNEKIPTLDEFIEVLIAQNLKKPLVIEIKHIYSNEGMEKLCLAINDYYDDYANHAEIIYLPSFDFPQRPVNVMSFTFNFPGPVKKNRPYWKKRLAEVGVAGIYKPIHHKAKLL